MARPVVITAIVFLVAGVLAPIFNVLTSDASVGEAVQGVLDAAIITLLVGGYLFFLRDVQTGLVWATKIVTDPFHDVKLYHRAPLQVLRGEWMEPAHAEISSRTS